MASDPAISIRQVRTIDAVASEASLARASAQLATSQSSLSRQIVGAERALGQRLFQRGWTGMEPTSAGEVVIAQCRRMVASIATAEAALRAAGARVAPLANHLTWPLLGAVDAVRTMGSVSGAAQRLGRSQPEISRALARIAAATGRQPFRRVRGGMEASGDALILSDLRGRLLADAAVLPDLLQALSGEVTGRVAVGLLPFSEQDVVMKAFGVMLDRYRHVRLLAVTGSYGALTEGVRRGELDFIIGPLRDPAPVDGLTELHLYDEAFAFVVRADHPLAHIEPDLAVLARQNWVVAPHGTPTRRYFEELLIQHGITPPAQTCEIVTFSLAEQMLLHSDAVGLLTYSERRRSTLSPGLRILPFALPEPARKVGATYRRQQPLTAAQRTFLDILVELRQT